MDFNSLLKLVQSYLGDGLAIVVGSGLSAAEGISGMWPLAEHLIASAGDVDSSDLDLWHDISSKLSAGAGLEETLLEYQPTESLEAWIADKTASLLVPEDGQFYLL